MKNEEIVELVRKLEFFNMFLIITNSTKFWAN